jgi:DNA-binding XRE family transcriptional regulator
MPLLVMQIDLDCPAGKLWRANLEATTTRLAYLRKLYDLTLEECGRALGVPRNVWWSWERNDVKPVPERRQQIADFFGVNMFDIWG